MSKRCKIVVAGFMARCPIAGVVWQHLHYIVGLQRLGHTVFYIEDSAHELYDPTLQDFSFDFGYAAETLNALAERYGFQGRWAFCARFHKPPQTAGLELSRIRRIYREADAIINVCGGQELNDDMLAGARLIYVESDPGVDQIKIDQGVEGRREYLGLYHALFTFGENIGSEAFPVPLHGLQWLATRQPVVTELWQTESRPTGSAAFTSVANLRTAGKKDIDWRGETYLWCKAPAFEQYIGIAEASKARIELASNMEEETAARFRRRGWKVVSADQMSIDHVLYKDYIQDSLGEFTVAKDQYHRLATGWFSDRSACYLAAGRPVVTQETGFTRFYGGAKGLLAFSDVEGAAEGLKAVMADYDAHSRAARDIAREYFEAEKVLASMLERAGV